jgi:hypothetical protein
MSTGREEFKKRLSRVVRRHRAMARGCRAMLRSDGLIIWVPAAESRCRGPWRPLLLVMAVAFVCQVALMLFKTDATRSASVLDPAQTAPNSTGYARYAVD